LALLGEVGWRAFGSETRASGKWSLETLDAAPPVGELVEVAVGHYVAQEAA
jgi:hypothetical protein